MIREHANRCFSGWEVSACYLQGYHDPDILFYRGSGTLNQEWLDISDIFLPDTSVAPELFSE